MPILSPDIKHTLCDDGPAARYAARLLEDLGISVCSKKVTKYIHPARRWAESGLMSLTGIQDDVSPVCPVPLPSCADGALSAFRALVPREALPGVEGAQLLAERAAIRGFTHSGTQSAGGHCRLISSRDGTIALNLARPSDWELLPALFQTECVGDWSRIESLVKEETTRALVSRGRLLGLAVVDAQSIPDQPCTWMNVILSSGAVSRSARPPRVVDLTSLWAGPLCSSLLQAAGAEVTKVESSQRPDGARLGPKAFFNLMNQGKQSLVLDLHLESGQRKLENLIRQSDIVLESSRPRALRQMNIVAEELIEQTPGLTWISITGYGRQEPQDNWIAYGDDAGIAAGLSAILQEVTGDWVICGDAIADPLTGIHAALAGWASWISDRGHLIDVSLEKTVRHCITATAPAHRDYSARHRRWQRYLHDNSITPLPPQSQRGLASSAR